MNSGRILYISGLIRKSILKQITLEEQSVLDEWLRESPRNQALFEKYHRPGFLQSVDPGKDLAEAEIAYALFKKKTIHKPIRRSILLWRYAAAASFVAFVCLSSFLYWNMNKVMNQVSGDTMVVNKKSLEVRSDSADVLLLTSDGRSIPMSHAQGMMTVSSGTIKVGNELIDGNEESSVAKQEVVYNTLKILRGKRFKMQLSDGTIVWLNADSEITFPNRFEEENRIVSVKGELFFEVAENKKHPFIVETKKGNVRVLGTAFNICCYENETPRTTLVRGKVEYSLGDKSVILKPGQQCSVTHDDLVVTNVDTYEYTSWIDEKIIFKEKRLEEIMTILSRMYNIDIVYEDSSLKNLSFTGAFKLYEHLEDIVQMIEDCGRIHIEQQKQQLIIRK